MMSPISLVVCVALMTISSPQPHPGLPPAHNTRRHDAVIHDRFRRGFVADDAVEDENIDQTSVRRDEDHFADAQLGRYDIRSNHGHVGEGGLFMDTKATQLDGQKQAIDRRRFHNDHLGVRRNAASLTTAQQETGSRAGRTGYRTALGGPFQANDYAYDMAEFNRLDNERIGRDTDYAKDADRTLVQYDRGVAERSAEAGALIAQDGGLGGGSDGFESGWAKTGRETGTVLSQSLLERGGALNELSKSHDAVGRITAKRASTALGPDGAVAADLVAKQDSWDRGDLNHRDQVRFLHKAHDNVADTTKEQSKAGVDLKVTVGHGLPGDISCGDRAAKAAESHDRVAERDAGDRLITNAETETIRTFDIGGKTVIDGNGHGIGIPPLA